MHRHCELHRSIPHGMWETVSQRPQMDNFTTDYDQFLQTSVLSRQLRRVNSVVRLRRNSKDISQDFLTTADCQFNSHVSRITNSELLTRIVIASIAICNIKESMVADATQSSCHSTVSFVGGCQLNLIRSGT